MIKRITDFLIDIIYKAHAYLLTLNDSYEAYLSDKELHFLIIGIMGVLMLMVFYPLFKWMSKRHMELLIAWFYVLTILVVIAFAIEIAQWYSNSGVMEFRDIVAGLAGYFLMSFVFIVIVRIVELIKKSHNS